MYVEYPTLDESDTRLYRVLPRAAYLHLREYAIVRFVGHLSDVLQPLGLYATVHMWHHEDRLDEIDSMHTPFQYVQEVSLVRHRLAGNGTLGGACLGNHV